MRPSLLDTLSCPVDGVAPLTLEPADGGERRLQGNAGDDAEIMEGALRCQGCGASFPIVDGLPSLLPPEDFRRQACAWPDQIGEQLKRDVQAATHEDDLSWYLTHLERALTLRALRPKRGDSILEVGAGTGRLTESLIGRCREIVAVDFSRASLQRLRERVRRAGNADAPAPTVVHPVHGDICFLPFRSGAFAKCLVGQVLQHLPGEAARKQGLGQLARVLRPGSRMVVSTYNFGRASETNAGPGRGIQREGFHAGGTIYYRRFASAELTQLLNSLFEVGKVRGFYASRLNRLGLIGLALNHALAATPLGLRWGHYSIATCALSGDAHRASRDWGRQHV